MLRDSQKEGRVFIAHAPHDTKFAELIAARARGDRLPITFETFCEGRSDDLSWQRECHRRIVRSGAMLVLVSPHSRDSARVKWQQACARAAGVPCVGIALGFPDDDAATTGSPGMEQVLVEWAWRRIAAMLLQFASGGPAARTTRAGISAEPVAVKLPKSPAA